MLVNIFVLYPLLVSESVLLFHGCETLGIVTDSGIFVSGSGWTCSELGQIMTRYDFLWAR